MIKKVSSTLAIISLLAAAGGGVYFLEDRYMTKNADAQIIESVKSNTDHKLILMEKTSAETFSQVQQNIQQNQKVNGVKFQQFLYNVAISRVYTLKELKRKHPNDQEIKDDYADAVKERDELKRQLDEKIELLNK